jgi:uncharacterized membrane protein YtjA (UPF0391 family)
MLRLAVVFLAVALVAALFGFGLVADYLWEGGKMLLLSFLVFVVLSFLGVRPARIRRQAL